MGGSKLNRVKVLESVNVIRVIEAEWELMANGEVDVFKESFKLLKKLSVQDLRDKVIDLSSGDSDKHPSEVRTWSSHQHMPARGQHYYYCLLFIIVLRLP